VHPRSAETSTASGQNCVPSLRLCSLSHSGNAARQSPYRRRRVASVRRPRWNVLTLGFCGVLLVTYLVGWLRIDQVEIARSDFTNTYIGATLLRNGEGGQMYDPVLQTRLHGELDPADRGGNLPFVAPPLAAALAVPVSVLPLDAAYRLWGLVQVGLLLAGLSIALRAAPSSRLTRRDVATIAFLSVTCIGTWAMLIEAQWDGVMALGLGVAYASFRRGRRASAGAALTLAALVAKPQLGLCLASFLLGRRDRRVLAGAAVAAIIAVGLSLAVAGTHGVEGFLGGLSQSTTRWQLTSFDSMIGIAATLTRNVSASYMIAAIGALTAMIVAAALGSAVKRRPERLEAGLAAAAVLSLFASPHAYVQDLALLVPAAAWVFAALWVRCPAQRRPLKPAIYLWVVLNAAAGCDLALYGSVLPGPLTPWVLGGAAAVASAACFRQGRTLVGSDLGDAPMGISASVSG
jgi:hypothetical protein